MAYTIADVSGMSGVSLDELSQYVDAGLLTPAFVGSDPNDMYYEKPELLKLQQILFCKELGVEQEEIGSMLQEDPYDMIQMMQQQRIQMLEKALRLHGLIQTLDKTISHLQGEQEIEESALYEGFVEPRQRNMLLQQPSSRADAMQRPKLGEMNSDKPRHNPSPENTLQSVQLKTKRDYLDSQEKIDGINRDLHQAIEDGLSADSPKVQQIISRHLEWVKGYYTPTAEIYRELGNLYVEHQNFRQMYDGYHPKLAEFLRDAMIIKAEQELS
ncbi:TipAS antibiotic-recognition domain-containing protein [Paenibacillus xylanexedens]|uniref:MerR family transcriptional regulator n=1 Tax=Paenibacillus xylanexedens TaxID=528191 RepID=UPI001643F0A5|nr:TipAS antibiotic-recognition domain-containing protein [Paenibacillus xylanexedens]